MSENNIINTIDKLVKPLTFNNLKQLFWEELNYTRHSEALDTADLTDALKAILQGLPTLFATAGEGEEFHVIYIQFNSAKMSQTEQRAIIGKLVKQHPYSLFIFSNKEQNLWHLVNNRLPDKDKDPDNPNKRKLIRRIVIGQDENLHTAISRIAMLLVNPDMEDIFSKESALSIQKQHDVAFDVEQVTKQFYLEYKAVFELLWKDLTKQTNDNKWAHDYSLQFLNRLMFLYFIQRKRWMDNNTEWLTTYWKEYTKAGLEPDKFVSDWLCDLFFYAFNDKKIFFPGRKYPSEIRQALYNAPYLNGGIFEENNLDTQYKYKFSISDKRFQQVLNFLNYYNFTVREDSPLDQEVAVDAEMLGKVYESLVNVSTEVDERGDAGIFYTQRIEIDLMVRLSIVDNLANNLGSQYKNVFYEYVFAMDSAEKAEADKQISELNLWNEILAHLKGIAIVDPACGSGAFLVGMLLVLDDLIERAETVVCNTQVSGKPQSSYQRRKQIICNSLFGVDVMQWAVEIAELRLWLQLVIETDIPLAELRNKPLLPKLTFKIRRGDSLVQPVPSIYEVVRNLSFRFSQSFIVKRNQLEKEKTKFFNNETTIDMVGHLETAEINLYRQGFDEIAKEFKERIFIKNKSANESMLNALGETEHTLSAEKRKQIQAEIVKDEKSLLEYNKHRDYVFQHKGFFTWDKDFSEVFQKGKDGFDIVIGNPPYVRQEKIADPLALEAVQNAEEKKAYKQILANEVYVKFPDYFANTKIPGRSDLYIYFYYIGLSLMNPNGSFCYITSNSWLDVGYGAGLQEFLLKCCNIKYIIDNQVKRSFSASVNTIIVLLSSPKINLKENTWGERVARFVNFTLPYEEIISAVIFSELDETVSRKTTEEYKVVVMHHRELMSSGIGLSTIDNEDDDTDFDEPERKYVGDKWGGKFLRAPDIYWKIIEHRGNWLSPLKNNAEVKYGLKTGANKFFYLNERDIKQWGVEKEYLKRVIFSFKELSRIKDDCSRVNNYIFFCHKDKPILRGTNALEYIKWGESQGFDERRTCAIRNPWYSIGSTKIGAPLVFTSKVGERFFVLENSSGIFEDKKLYGIRPSGSIEDLNVVLNSTIFRLFFEVPSRQLTGAQTLSDIDVCVIENALILHPQYVNEKMRVAYRSMAERAICNRIDDELKMEDRIILDNEIIKVLGLAESDRVELYDALKSHIHERALKSKSM